MSRPALLHNMSAPPRMVIQHKAAAPAGQTLAVSPAAGNPEHGAGRASRAADGQQLDQW